MDRLDCDRAFIAVLEAGSFSRAAARMGVSSGQASKLVSKLEAELGVRLINRTTRALSATEAGRAYYERLRALIEEFDALDASVRDVAGVARGRLRLTAPLTFGTMQLAGDLIEFAETYPEIELDVSFTDRVVNLIEEGFDVAVRVGPPADSSLIARRLCDNSIATAASPDYLQAHGAPEKPADLANHVCIVDTNFRDPLVWRYLVNGETIGVPVKPRARFSNAEACLKAAEAGLGVVRLPSFAIGRSIQTGALVRLLGDFGTEPGGVFALFPPGRGLALKVRVLIDFLAKRYRGGAPWEQAIT
jgi:DNA-binding transcriptional LysR family regulator